MKSVVISLFISTLLLTCGTTNVVKYLYTFENIDKTQTDVIQKERIFGRYNHYYADNNIEMHFDINPYEIGIQVKNLSYDPIRIIWEDISLVTGIDEYKMFNLYNTNRPKFVLFGMTIVDVLKNKDKGYFLPYEQRDRAKLKREAEKMVDNIIILNFIYMKNDKKELVPIKLKVKDYYILKKG